MALAFMVEYRSRAIVSGRLPTRMVMVPDEVSQIVHAHIVAANRNQRRFEVIFGEHPIIDMTTSPSRG